MSLFQKYPGERAARGSAPPDLPIYKAPANSHWTRVSTLIRSDLNARIAQLELLRDRPEGCIGRGYLSLQTCALYNPADSRAADGPGPRALIPD